MSGRRAQKGAEEYSRELHSVGLGVDEATRFEAKDNGSKRMEG